MRLAVIAALFLPWAAPAQIATCPRIEFPLALFREGAAIPPSGQRVTLLLNVGSLLPRRAASSGAERMPIYAVISTLTHGASAVKLVVFDADRQHELLRRETFSMADLTKVTAAMEKWRLGPVDYHDLRREPGGVDIVAALINEQLRAIPPPDAVVFVDPGPWERTSDKRARNALDIPRGARPRFFALQFDPAAGFAGWGRGRPGSNFPARRPGNPNPSRPAQAPASTQGPPPPPSRDKIRPAVARLDGKTFFMRTPDQLYKAIAEIEQQAGGGKR